MAASEASPAKPVEPVQSAPGRPTEAELSSKVESVPRRVQVELEAEGAPIISDPALSPEAEDAAAPGLADSAQTALPQAEDLDESIHSSQGGKNPGRQTGGSISSAELQKGPPPNPATIAGTRIEPGSTPPEIWGDFSIFGKTLAPGTRKHLSWSANTGHGALDQPAPVLVVHGKNRGPVMCLAAAIHGDELNGIDIVRRVVHELDPETLNGTVVAVPIVNLSGFRRGSRYLPDRRDLNRHFPGDPKGSFASRIAHSFFTKVIRNGCHVLIDIHTGSFRRTNLTQLRADLRDHSIADLAHGFGKIAVLNSAGTLGTLRRAAAEIGIPSVTMEAGEPLRLQPKEVSAGVRGVKAAMSHLGMIEQRWLWREPQPIYYESKWVRAERPGILFSKVKLGDKIKKGELLGTVTDPVTNKSVNILAPYDGSVLGRALNQFVMPGFAAYHMGIESSQERLVKETALEQAAEDAGDIAEVDRPERLNE